MQRFLQGPDPKILARKLQHIFMCRQKSQKGLRLGRVMMMGREEDFHWSKMRNLIKADSKEAGLHIVQQSQMLGLYIGSYFQGILEYCKFTSAGQLSGSNYAAPLEDHMRTRMFGIMGVLEFDIPSREEVLLMDQVR